jgi:hypothetical protein
MQSEKFERERGTHDQSYGEVLKEISTSVKDLLESEVSLVKAEIRDSSRSLGKHSGQAAIFGALAGMSVLPFLAFLIIGIGKLMGDQYWLSSLIVAAVCAIVGGAMTARAYKKIKEQDLTLPAARQSLEREKDVVTGRVEDLKDSTDSSKRSAA